MSKNLLGWSQIRGLEHEAVDPALPPLTWDIPLELVADYQTHAEAILAALRIGYNLGLRAARGQDLRELPRQKLPNPLYDSIMSYKQEGERHDGTRT